jgi:C4-dicarboxylate-specific signal transduction histidine kinase
LVKKSAASEKNLLRRAERFYLVVFVASTIISLVSFGGLLGVSAMRTNANTTLASLAVAQGSMQQVSVRLNVIDPQDSASLKILGAKVTDLQTSTAQLSKDVAAVASKHPVLVNSERRISYWYGVVKSSPTPLNISRAKTAFQNASEILSDELQSIEQELAKQSAGLVTALTFGYIVMGLSILAAIYFLGIMFMSIRSILVWDESMIRSFARKESRRALPTIKVPLARFFPGSTLLTEQSHTIASNFGAQVEVQRSLAKKNAKLSDRLQKTVTELVDSREEFARSSQLAAVGKVAGSVSHEINNPVTGVLGYLAFIKKRSTDESLVVWIDKAIKEVERIGRIARSLLVFSRHSATMAPAAFDVGPVVDNVVTLVGPQMREAEVEIIVDPITNLPQAIGRVDELQQCLLNVLLNARYALLDQPQKKIWIEMNKSGDSVEISIRDSGAGIPAKVQEHLFQPFYTTKPAGQGSGLGLAVAHELMTGMGGSIRFDKTYGPGARFVLATPIFDAKKAAKAAESAAAAETTTAAVLEEKKA